VHGEGKDTGIALKNRRSAIALMDIEIDDEDLFG
jgi:hypothetical protein